MAIKKAKALNGWLSTQPTSPAKAWQVELAPGEGRFIFYTQWPLVSFHRLLSKCPRADLRRYLGLGGTAWATVASMSCAQATDSR